VLFYLVLLVSIMSQMIYVQVVSRRYVKASDASIAPQVSSTWRVPTVVFRFRYVHQIGILSIVVIDVRDHREAEREG
jgi:hypothetical protein